MFAGFKARARENDGQVDVHVSIPVSHAAAEEHHGAIEQVSIRIITKIN